MSVLQKVKFYSNERVDLPDLKNIENFACADWAQFFDKFMSNQSMVIQGFDISNPKGLCGTSLASGGINIVIANSVMFHPTSSNAGGGFYVASSSEVAQLVSLSENATNYIELDQTTETDESDIRKFWSPDTADGEGQEFSQIVDTVTYLKVEVSSNTVGFTEGRIPIAKVVTTTLIQSITDCRPMFFRLGSGGISPNPLSNYGWPDVPSGNARTDSPVTVTAASPAGTNPFKGSDKNMRHLRDWMEAVMTRIKELGSTPYWFTKSGLINNAAMGELWWDSIGSKITGNGDYKHTAGPTFEWTTDIVVKSILGNYEFTIPANTIVLNDDEVAYLVQERNVDLTGGSDLTWVNGVSYVNGSAGAFIGLAIGDWIKKVSDGIEKYAQITDFHANLDGGGAGGQPPATALSVDIATNYSGTATSEKGVYAKGTYGLVKALRSAIANDSNVWWLAMNMKNGGGTDYFYIRGGLQLIQGENIEIGNETSTDTIDYIGAADDADATPDYDSYSEASGAKTGTQSYNSTNDENLTKRDSLLTSMMADKAQDKNVRISGGGDLMWNLAAPNLLSFTADITVSIGSSVNLNTIQQATQSPQTIPAGSCVYFTINRNAAANLTLTVSTLASVLLDENTFILAYHDANDSHLYFMDGTRCVDGQQNHLGGIDALVGSKPTFVTVDNINGDFIGNTDVAIQAAVDSIKSTTGGTIYIRRGAYQLNKHISFENATKAIKILGDGEATKLNLSVVNGFFDEGFIDGVGENKVVGQFAVANPTSFSIGDFIEIYDGNTNPSTMGWISAINVGGGAGGEDIVTVTSDSAGTTPINIAAYLQVNGARAAQFSYCAFTLPDSTKNITFENFWVTNTAHNASVAFVSLNAQNIVWDNITVRNITRDNIFCAANTANGNKHIQIRNCDLETIAIPPIATSVIFFKTYGSDVYISNNVIKGTAAYAGILLGDYGTAETPMGERWIIENNKIAIDGTTSGAAARGIFVGGAAGLLSIVDNIITVECDAGSEKKGIDINSGNITLSDCVIRGVIVGNNVWVGDVARHASDQALIIMGLTAGLSINDFVITGNNLQAPKNDLNSDAVWFGRTSHIVFSGNRVYGGNSASVSWPQVAGQYNTRCEHGYNFETREPYLAGFDEASGQLANMQRVKAWLYGAGNNIGNLTQYASWNISSGTYAGSTMTVSFNRPMANNNYTVIATPGPFPTIWRGFRVGALFAGSFDIIQYREQLGVINNYNWGPLIDLHVMVIGVSANRP